MRERKNDDETDLVFYRNGPADNVDITDRICPRCIKPTCKRKRKDRAAKSFIPCVSQIRLIQF